MTEIECEMFDKVISHQSSPFDGPWPGAAGGDSPKVGLHRVPFQEAVPGDS